MAEKDIQTQYFSKGTYLTRINEDLI